MFDRIEPPEWMIHFVNDKNLENDPSQWSKEPQQLPVRFIEGEPQFSDWDFSEVEFTEPGGSAFQVLKQILNSGLIKSGWSSSNQRATIYGPNSVVCFTEMPLNELLAYATQRKSEANMDTYGIAIMKNEFWKLGGRPVIYGLSGEHKEVTIKDINFGMSLRCLDASCGIGLNEQYRYVTMNFNSERWLDWTPEREWRWACTGELSKISGLPIWLESACITKVLVIVQTSEEAKCFLDELKDLYDSGFNNYDFPYDKKILSNTLVLALEEIDDNLISKGILRIEDLPLKQLPIFSAVVVSNETLENVKRAFQLAKIKATKAAEDFKKIVARNQNGEINDVFGFAYVKTRESHTAVTQALHELGYAKPIGDKGYCLYDLTSNLETEGILSVEKVAASAAVEILTELLGQTFYFESRWD